VSERYGPFEPTSNSGLLFRRQAWHSSVYASGSSNLSPSNTPTCLRPTIHQTRKSTTVLPIARIQWLHTRSPWTRVRSGGPAGGSLRVCRGGCWQSRAVVSPCVPRQELAGVRGNDLHFRLARSSAECAAEA
jgi:hypothetical protein